MGIRSMFSPRVLEPLIKAEKGESSAGGGVANAAAPFQRYFANLNYFTAICNLHTDVGGRGASGEMAKTTKLP